MSDLDRSKKFYEDIVGLEEHNRVPKEASDSEVRMIFFGTKGGTRTTGVHHALVIVKRPIVLMYRKRSLKLKTPSSKLRLKWGAEATLNKPWLTWKPTALV